ncbi:unnamed protein product [Mesocestoides corti]|uniref:Zinc finger protein n=1 Tax=Mesocestoides corti TaxID=53468 RepID=A0A0R3UAJ7_MESCO|nr:unnamed protein product [Mesocestoides corti]
MARSHWRGVVSACVFIPSGTYLGSSDSICFKCLFTLLVEPMPICRQPLVLVDAADGFTAHDLDTNTTLSGASSQWVSNLRAAQNCCDQNVEIARVSGKRIGRLAHLCGCHGNQTQIAGPLRFYALKDINFGCELLVWPDLLLSLTIGLPFLTIQHIKNPASYHCTRCNRAFAQPNCLKSHLFLDKCHHRESSPRAVTSRRSPTRHTCSFCGKQYARRYSLVIHLRTHTGQKPLVCRICSRRFGDPSNLNKHLRIHATGTTVDVVNNPYICQICGNVSARRRDLERHMRRKHASFKLDK